MAIASATDPRPRVDVGRTHVDHAARWVLVAALAATTSAVFELFFVLPAVPVAGSSSSGSVHLFVGLVSLYALVAIAAGVVGRFVERRLTRSRYPEPALQLTVLFFVVSIHACLSSLRRSFPQRFNEFPEQVDWVRDVAGVVVVVGVAVVALFAVRPLAAKLAELAPTIVRPRPLACFIAFAASFGAFAFAHLVAGPLHLGPLAGLAAACGVVLAVVAWRWAIPIPTGRRRFAAPALLVALAITAGAISSRNEHARFVLFGYCHGATALAGLLRDAVDLDSDGSAPTWLGGADCDEWNADRGPLNRDQAGDGIDQDCTGSDAPAPDPPARVGAWPGCDLARDRVSVVLVTIDAIRAELLNDRVMPRLRKLSTASINFSRAYSPATLTMLSVASMFAGRPVYGLGSDNVYVDKTVTPGSHPLARAFLDAGYRTAAFNLFDLPDWFFAGFSERNPYWSDPMPRGPKEQFAAAAVTNGVSSWIRARREAAHFVWIHYSDPHAPYLDPKLTEDVSGLDAYEREARYVDFHVGRLLSGLESSGLLARTVVAVTADHGESLGLRGRQGHGPDVFEESIHVPLVLWVPGCRPLTIDDPVSLTQLAPTIAQLAGVEFDGRTLFPGHVTGDLPVVAEAALTTDDVYRRAVVHGRHKLMIDVRSGGRLLFDLIEDPGENRNVYPVEPDAAREMERLYRAWLDRGGLP